MSDIVERLRRAQLNHDELRFGWLAEAADEIVRLRARVAELEAAQAWRPLYDEGRDEWLVPADVNVLLFMPATHPQLPAEIKADFARSTRGGWFAGWATHWMPLPEPPKEGT